MLITDSIDHSPWAGQGDAVAASAGRTELRFSFVIANYNYGRFVARAIDSALQQRWPNIEVIVVDDGSTDDSRTVIDRYASRVTVIYQANSGQRVANNNGFAASSGDIVVFLDADDVVDPDFAPAVAEAWRPGLSKVQVQMARVDVDERPLGTVVPAIDAPPSPEDVRAWATATSEYPTPPGSGNAYSRDFLTKIFPIGPEDDAFSDSTCLVLAPFLGDVVTVLRPLVLYRQHGANDSDLFADERRFGREVARAMRRQASAERTTAKLGGPAPDAGCLRLGRHLLQLRAASLISCPQAHPMPKDGRFAVLLDAGRSLFTKGSEPPAKRMLIAAWTVAVMLTPRPIARMLIRKRFDVRRQSLSASGQVVGALAAAGA